jgi:hypothetical protein
MNRHFEIGKVVYFPLHGVGRIMDIQNGILKVDCEGIVAYVDEIGRPVYQSSATVARGKTLTA